MTLAPPPALPTGRLRWPWPLPALSAWLLAWAGWWLAREAGATPVMAWAAGAALGSVLALTAQGAWRQSLVMAGFPLSAWAVGASGTFPAWAWLALLLPVLLVYPLRAWRDAPFFPTPAGALLGLQTVVGEPRRVLDAGCGLGHGLRALHRLWPVTELHGVEWSVPLAVFTRLRCSWARVQRGDLWAQPWTGFDLVYVFQRPESMPRIWAKACAEQAAGSWLVSLAFEVPDVQPWARLQPPGQRPLWVYRVPGPEAVAAAGSAGPRAHAPGASGRSIQPPAGR